MALSFARSILSLTMRGALQSPAVSAISFSAACIFHEIFRKGVIEQGVTPLSRGAALSQRQRECLELAAHGLTTEDIALSSTSRFVTAQFHFDCIRTKVGAANRQEAVARGIAQGGMTA